MHFLTWDTGILAALGVLLAYSLFIRKHKSLATLVSLYIAYLVAATWGDQVYQLFTGQRTALGGVWIKANATPAMVEVGILILVTFLLSSFLKLGGRRSKYGALEIIAYSIATLALGVMFVVSFLDPVSRAHVLSISKIVPYIYTWKQWVLGVPVLMMVFFGIYSEDD